MDRVSTGGSSSERVDSGGEEWLATVEMEARIAKTGSMPIEIESLFGELAGA